MRSFERDGYLIVRGLFSTPEIDLIRAALTSDDEIGARAYGLADGHGGATSIALWNNTGEDTIGLIPRLNRMAGTAATLLGDEVYHYHSKTTNKAPGGGGTWDWHQDYGYWYGNGCLRPDMLTVAIAVGRQTLENGCLRLLRGSNRCGRIDHIRYGDQQAADLERVEVLRNELETVAFEAEAGDALFFHCNTLHSSSPNVSDEAREILLCAYNTRSNDPIRTHHHPRYTPLTTMPDETLLARGLVFDTGDRQFLDPTEDVSIESFQAEGSA